METSAIKGLSFGMTSGVITTLGLIVGIDAGTNSRLAIMAGIVAIAVADAFSDASAMHVSEEAEKVHSSDQVRSSTLWTFVAKFVVAMSFLVPFLILHEDEAVVVDVVWGLLLTAVLNYFIAKQQKETSLWPIVEHVGIAVIVIAITYFVGTLISYLFGTS